MKKTFGSRVHVLRLSDAGQGGAKCGSAFGAGEFVGFLDSDDVWLPGKLEAELRVFASFPPQTPSSPTVKLFRRTTGWQQPFRANWSLAATRGRVRLADDCEWLWTNSMNTAYMCGITVRRKALARLGQRLFAEDLSCCEDWEFQMRLYLSGSVAVLPEVYSWVRRFDDGSRLDAPFPARRRQGNRSSCCCGASHRDGAIEAWLHDLRPRSRGGVGAFSRARRKSS